jgi:hypothetical protein
VSYLFSPDLQAAVYQSLADDPTLAGLVGAAIYDGPPEGVLDPDVAEYVTLGEERVRDGGSKTSLGSVHDFEVTVFSSADGFDRAKRIAAAICANLVDTAFDLDGARVVGLRFLRARAERGASPVKRKIALRFRAVIDGV